MTALASRPVSAPPARGFWHACAALFFAGLAAVGVAVTYHVFVRTSLGQAVDTAALHGADVDHPRAVELMSRALNGTTPVSLVLVCLAAAAIGMMRKRIDLALGATLLVIGANASTQLLKTQLPRPRLDDFPAPNSFPSGHTAAAASVALALVMVLPAAVRGTVALIGAGYVTVIAVATVWAAWHRPSDTVAALLVVLAWGALAVFGIRVRRYRELGTPRLSRVAGLPLILIGAITGVAGLLGLIAVALSVRVSPDLVSGRFAFLAGVACITSAVAGVFIAWMRLVSSDPA